MKQLLLIIFLATACFNLVLAQTEKGGFLIGITSTVTNTGITQLGYQTEKRKGDGFETEPQKTFSFILSPKFGLFVWDNVAAGIEGQLSIARIKNDLFSGDDVKGTAYIGGPFVRYYYSKKKVRPFAEASALFGKSKFDFDDPNPDGFDLSLNSNITSYGGGIGLAAQLGNKVSFDTILVYNTVIEKSTDDNLNNERTITSGIRFKVGFSLYLN